MRRRSYWLILESRLGQCVLGAVRCLSRRVFLFMYKLLANPVQYSYLDMLFACDSSK